MIVVRLFVLLLASHIRKWCPIDINGYKSLRGNPLVCMVPRVLLNKRQIFRFSLKLVICNVFYLFWNAFTICQKIIGQLLTYLFNLPNRSIFQRHSGGSSITEIRSYHDKCCSTFGTVRNETIIQQVCFLFFSLSGSTRFFQLFHFSGTTIKTFTWNGRDSPEWEILQQS